MWLRDSVLESPQFWSLCGSYTRLITDSSTIETHVEIRGQSKTVSNYADSAPAWVAELEDAIDEGWTPLMYAAASSSSPPVQ
jgi:hypothetical protein